MGFMPYLELFGYAFAIYKNAWLLFFLFRKLEDPQTVKMLTASSDDSIKKSVLGVSSSRILRGFCRVDSIYLVNCFLLIWKEC